VARFFFIESLLEYRQDREIRGATGGSLALDYIGEGGYHQVRFAERQLPGAASKAGQRPCAVDRRHEIDLKSVPIANDPEQVGRRIERTKDYGAQMIGQLLQFSDIGGSFAEQEIEVHGGDGRALEGGGGVPDQQGFEAQLFHQSGDPNQMRSGIHEPFHSSGWVSVKC
jgi:hypothetical protein